MPAPPRVVKLAVSDLPRSGEPARLRSLASVDADHIAAASRRLVRSNRPTAIGHGC
jgi:hypothetical protein